MSGGCFYVDQLQSLNGTFLNGVSVRGSETLKEVDVITFGCVGGHDIRPGERIRNNMVAEFSFVFERGNEVAFGDCIESQLRGCQFGTIVAYRTM